MSGVCLLSSGPLAADPHSPTRPPRSGPPALAPIPSEDATANLDGIYLVPGAVGGAARVEDRWDSSVGGHLSLFSVAEARAISLWGIDAGIAQYGARPGGRAWLGAVAGAGRLGPLAGLAVGPAAEWDPVEPPRFGAQATAWLFAGVVPAITLGWFDRTGLYLELGLRLSLPAVRFRRRALP
jgi:hypothetical protein